MNSHGKIPDGFRRMPPRGPFFANNGPFYFQPIGADGVARYGFLPEDKHCNSLNFVHGGLIATFLDSAMAQTVATKHGYALLTTNLNVSYENLIAKGRWAMSVITLEPPNGELVTAKAVLRSRGTICTQAAGTFKLMRNRPLNSP